MKLEGGGGVCGGRKKNPDGVSVRILVVLFDITILVLKHVELHGGPVQTEDVSAGGEALEVEAVFFGAVGNHSSFDQFAVDVVD